MIIFVDFIRNHSNMFSYNGMSVSQAQLNTAQSQSDNIMVC